MIQPTIHRLAYSHITFANLFIVLTCIFSTITQCCSSTTSAKTIYVLTMHHKGIPHRVAKQYSLGMADIRSKDLGCHMLHTTLHNTQERQHQQEEHIRAAQHPKSMTLHQRYGAEAIYCSTDLGNQHQQEQASQ